MAILEKIAAIEAEMQKTQKNKATAKLRAQLLEPPKSKAAGDGFDVQKSGDARVALLGFPSVGKSSLLSKITKTASAAASYEFTTLTAASFTALVLFMTDRDQVPGVLEHEGARIQILDLPGIVQGASEGKGRGRQVISVLKTADLILMMLDSTKSTDQRTLLEAELDAVGVRVNQAKPDIVLRKKLTGGISITSTVPMTNLSPQTIRSILADSKLHNMDVMIRQPNVTVDEFIDVLVGNRRYLPCLYVYNKIDAVSIELVDKLAREPNTVVISCADGLNLSNEGGLVDRIWESLGLLRVYTKKRGDKPDFGDPLVVRRGSTVEDVARQVHRSLVDDFKYCLVWGRSSRFNPQPYKCGLSHQLLDQDVISIAVK